jgi:hypothetical protein
MKFLKIVRLNKINKKIIILRKKKKLKGYKELKYSFQWKKEVLLKIFNNLIKRKKEKLLLPIMLNSNIKINY